MWAKLIVLRNFVKERNILLPDNVAVVEDHHPAVARHDCPREGDHRKNTETVKIMAANCRRIARTHPNHTTSHDISSGDFLETLPPNFNAHLSANNVLECWSFHKPSCFLQTQLQLCFQSHRTRTWHGHFTFLVFTTLPAPDA